MIYLRRLLDPLFPFSKLEDSLLKGAVERIEDVGLRDQIRSRTGAVTRIYREVNGKVAILIAKRHPKAAISTPLSEWLFCTVTFRTPSHPKPIRAKVWIVSGDLFSIECNEAVRKLRQEKAEIIKVEFNDLNPKVEYGPVPSVEELRKFLGPWSDTLQFSQIKGPFLGGMRDARIGQLGRLPSDYLALTKLTRGFDLPTAKVLGLEEAREIGGETENFIVLAEMEDANFIVYT